MLHNNSVEFKLHSTCEKTFIHALVALLLRIVQRISLKDKLHGDEDCLFQQYVDAALSQSARMYAISNDDPRLI
jgi:hypothetical protein